MAYASEPKTIDYFTCSVCKDIYTDPVNVPCSNGHVACRECMNGVLKTPSPKCPNCREELKNKALRTNRTIATQLKTLAFPCEGCKQNILLCDMSQHTADCSSLDRTILQFKPVKQTTQRIPKNLPNRSTFKCPYCSLKNFDASGLVKHCNEKHRFETAPVVCPVCASMPWGDSGQASADFIKHLNLRHKFEYDTYVDYGQDDDGMLDAAIRASLENS